MKVVGENTCLAKLWTLFSYIRVILTHWLFVAASLPSIIFLLWFHYPKIVWYLQGRSPVTEYAEIGVFGDMYGALNTLFSGLAFSAVVVTLLLQKRQLAVSQLELKLTRDEMASQSDLFKIQTEVMNQQLFEGTVFQLLGFYKEQSSKIRTGETQGREAWNMFYYTMNAEIDLQNYNGFNYSGYDRAMNLYNMQSVISPVSLALKLLKYIDESMLISNEKKQFYVELLKTNLADAEIYFMAVIAVYDEKFSEYQKYIEKYAVLDCINTECTLPSSVFTDYSMNAYRSLRTEVFDYYISRVKDAGVYSAIVDGETNEFVCELALFSRFDVRSNVLNEHNFNCFIR
ncbi:putative phage abortive infection protein [Aeromonas veronii]|uniref:putative phage abortive infection protein n=1 Tax=Aeromonas veronii TaxID=654 RepID=UPI00111739CD|nr:putative phage abortive infection protein [Aeromonas veronii]